MMKFLEPYSNSLLRTLLIAGVVFTLLIVGFVGLVDEVMEGDTLAYDERILYAVNEHSTPLLDRIMPFLTDTGSIGVAILVAVGAVIYLHARRTYRALFLLITVGGASVLSVLLKLLFERPRPDLWEQLVVESTFAFPSGHAIASSALALAAIVLFWQSRYRVPVLIGAVVYTGVIAYSRLYLGVHYPTDILGGWLISAAWVTLVTTIMWQRHRLRSVQKTK